eukprot:CAMPEP_0113548138 /NCGR_PEP_ID=MMETSP0015_2-20120614/12733_1 /TAXON_ID=2838 /ORGANISM="Odontella" /LENGTH=372 /DNA_ID=CAMNT_0000448747 /DNA_START=23 /DNA_END=1141 /DNA_ORIENTATION=- /assembly_acc=CAM_ASM_000160
MDTPLEESNLAYIGSDEDKAAREAAASCEVDWEGAGKDVGVQVWRVENQRSGCDTADFGINPWPKNLYGQFHRGDSYIVLETSEDADGSLFWDIYFWIGSESSQDEYGVAAYKANELDDLLGDVPIQHREVEGYESPEFLACFSKTGIQYLEGGMDSGFRQVDADEGSLELPTSLCRIRRKNNVTCSFEVPLACASLNEGDAFLLDIGKEIYTWYGSECSPFEKSKAANLAHNIATGRHGITNVTVDVDDDNEAFWELLGGKGEVMPATAVTDEVVPDEEKSLYSFSHEGGKLIIEEIEPSRENLDGEKVCVLDNGSQVYVWIGNKSSKSEQEQAMLIVENFLKNHGRTTTTSVMRVKEGQEGRGAFGNALA